MSNYSSEATFKVSGSPTSTQKQEEDPKHQALIERLSKISQKTEAVLARLEQEEESRNNGLSPNA